MERHRYQIYLEPEQYETLRRLAFERRTSIADLLREAIGAYLTKGGMNRPPKKKAKG